jgi:DNA mismatch endonuclease (patch repair protein)
MKRRDTEPEVAIRSRLHGLGYRFRVDAPILPDLRRRGDIVLRTLRAVVFVDGCFWHRCPEHATFPKANADWWRAKLAANVKRDRDTDARLRSLGWLSIRVWEHEDASSAERRISRMLAARSAAARRRKMRPTRSSA